MTDRTLNRFVAYGTAAERGAFTPSPPTPSSGPSPLYIWYETDTGSTYVYSTGWHLVAAASATRTIVMPQGRLTLVTATPVMTSDQTAKTTIYYTPYKGSYVPIWGGSSTTMTVFTELSQATTDATKSPAACTTNSNYDLFVWSDSGTIRCTRGPLWSSDTSRGTGAGTTQISMNTDGYYTNTVAITNGPGAGLGTYVGTIRTNGSSQVDYIIGGTGAGGGEATILGVWNCYNRVQTQLINYDNTDTWAYTTATIRIKNGNNNNKISFVVGLSEDVIDATNAAMSANSSSGINRLTFIGLDSTSAYAGFNSSSFSYQARNANDVWSGVNRFIKQAPLGFHYLAPLEWSTASGTTTWYGDNASGGTFTSAAQNAIFMASILA
jgi:hypothetical protein